MTQYSAVFCVIGAVAAVYGFTAVAGSAAESSRFVSMFFFVLGGLTWLAGRGRTP